MRLRICFAKTEAMRYTSHLDLYRAWERTVRRASLPLAYTQGFKPHPRINIASALPLGYTGEAEIVDIWLEDELPLGDVNNALHQASPPGIQIIDIQEVEPHAPTLQKLLVASEYVITLLDPLTGLEPNLDLLVKSKSLPRARGEKSYDLRPLILEIRQMPGDEDGCQRLMTHLSAIEGATGRPDEVIRALGGIPEAALVNRTRLLFDES